MTRNEEGHRQRTASGVLSPHRTAALPIIIIYTTRKHFRCSQQHENQIWLLKYSTDPRSCLHLAPHTIENTIHLTWDLRPQTPRFLRRYAVRQVRQIEAAAAT